MEAELQPGFVGQAVGVENKRLDIDSQELRTRWKSTIYGSMLQEM